MLGEPLKLRRQLTIMTFQDKAQRLEVTAAIHVVQVVDENVESSRLHTIKSSRWPLAHVYVFQ